MPTDRPTRETSVADRAIQACPLGKSKKGKPGGVERSGPSEPQIPSADSSPGQFNPHEASGRHGRPWEGMVKEGVGRSGF